MQRKLWFIGIAAACAVLAGTIAVMAQAPQPADVEAILGSGFNYQGQLKNGGAPVTGSCNIAFRLYDAAGGGNPVGSVLTQTLGVSNGLFATNLNFGATAFNGDARWLDMQVRCPAGVGAFTALSPRQSLAAAPYALNLRPGAVVSGTLGGIGANYGGIFTATNANTSAGVYGVNPAASGLTRGVWGESDSPGGHGVFGEDFNGGVGVGGYSNSNSGVYGQSSSGPGVYGQSTSGSGVFGQASSGAGVYGQNTAGTRTGDKPGVYGTADAEDGGQFYSTQANGIFASGGNIGAWATGGAVGVHGSSSDGVGVRGRTTTGTAMRAEGNGASTIALEINNGALKLSGAVSPAMVVTSTSSSLKYVVIDNPLSNNDPNVMILVTTVEVNFSFQDPVGVEYDDASGKWRVFDMFLNNIPTGQVFNVLIIKH